VIELAEFEDVDSGVRLILVHHLRVKIHRCCDRPVKSPLSVLISLESDNDKLDAVRLRFTISIEILARQHYPSLSGTGIELFVDGGAAPA
jgi:hypothetical protein